MERRSITVDADVNRRILNFRAFLLAHGLDVDYTAAINLLAGHGFDELRKSGLGQDLLDRLGRVVDLDEATKDAISTEWSEWKTPGLEAGGQETAARESRIRSKTQSSLTSQGKMKSVEALCLKCGKKREMKDPHETVLKGGRKAVQGTCPVCGGKMSRTGSIR